VLLIEHHLDVIKTADHVIDSSPAAGMPEERIFRLGVGESLRPQRGQWIHPRSAA
jgi:excinuclease UvrABC ATPase subunit